MSMHPIKFLLTKMLMNVTKNTEFLIRTTRFITIKVDSVLISQSGYM